MSLPLSFDEVSYFNNEYRGDLIVTKGILYFIPHTRVKAARFSDELGFQESAQTIGLIGNLVPFFGAAPWIYQLVDKSVKFGKFVSRSIAPSINKPSIKGTVIWERCESDKMLQQRLDLFIRARKSEVLEFSDDSVPKPMRFAVEEIRNLRLGSFKLRFETEYDDHDFRINPIRRNLFKNALKEGGFLN